MKEGKQPLCDYQLELARSILRRFSDTRYEIGDLPKEARGLAGDCLDLLSQLEGWPPAEGTDLYRAKWAAEDLLAVTQGLAQGTQRDYTCYFRAFYEARGHFLRIAPTLGLEAVPC